MPPVKARTFGFPVSGQEGRGLTFRSAEAAASGSETSIICLEGM